MIIGDDLDLCGNKLVNARMDVYMGSPLTTGVGSFGFNEALGRFEVFDGTVWLRYVTHIDLLNYSLVGHSHSYEDLDDLPDLSVLHWHDNLDALGAVQGINTGDQSSSDFDIKDLSDTTNLRSIWSDKQDALTFSTNIETDKASTTKISAIKTMYDWATGLFIKLNKIVTTWSTTPSNANIPSEKLVKDSLNLKADITPADGSTSALRALFIARSWDRGASEGAETYRLSYNASTGYYEMNGINDLTEADVLEIYIASIPLRSNTSGTGVVNLEGVLAYRNCRTNFPLNYFSSYYSCTIRYLAQGNKKLEKFIHIGFYGLIQPVNIASAFNGCILLNEVSILDLTHITLSTNVGNVFLGCASLVTVSIKNLKVSFSFGSSPLLSLASLTYLVANRANGTTRITITVHPTVWAKLNDAVNYPTWNALLVDAVNNQYIDFASA